MFKALHKDTTYVGQHQPLSREEFYNFYEVQDMRWKEVSNKLYLNLECRASVTDIAI